MSSRNSRRQITEDPKHAILSAGVKHTVCVKQPAVVAQNGIALCWQATNGADYHIIGARSSLTLFLEASHRAREMAQRT
jgi:hypothetical protein